MRFERLGVLAILVCLAIAIGLVGNTALAATITASDDTWVREDSPDSNRNGNDQVNARTDSDADDNDVILLRFDVTGLKPVSGTTLNLVWYRDDSSSDKTLSLYGLNESDPDEATWAEGTVTYNNAPGLVPDGVFPMNGDPDPQDLDLANLTLLVADQPYGPQVTNQVYTFSGAALDAFINADTNNQVSFLILRNVNTSSNQARFQVKEVGTGAYLSTPVIPEPASLVLAMLGLFGAAAFVRRR